MNGSVTLWEIDPPKPFSV